MPFHLPSSFLPRHPSLRYFTLSALGLITWIPPIIFLKDNYFQIASVSGPSMYPYLNSQYNTSTQRDTVLLSVQRPWDGLRRGQLVAFWAPHNPEKVVVKRVVALEGDEVQTRLPYPKAVEVIPSGYIWVEGDMQDRHKTLDSNTYGPISKSLIVGQLKAIVWPWKQMAWLDPKDYPGTRRVKENAHEIEQGKIFGE